MPDGLLTFLVGRLVAPAGLCVGKLAVGEIGLPEKVRAVGALITGLIVSPPTAAPALRCFNFGIRLGV